MICRRCFAKNADSSVSCSECGTPFPKKPAATKKKLAFALPIGAAVLCFGTYIVFTLVSRSPRAEKTGDPIATSETAARPEFSTSGLPILTTGDVVIRGFLDAVIAKIPAAVVGGQWVAVPVWALIGGENLDWRWPDSTLTSLENGFWTPGDPLSLWRIEDQRSRTALDLFPWKQGEPVRWHPLFPDTDPFLVEIISPHKSGSFISLVLPEEIRKPGLFLQVDGIVGWTFGEEMERGYLWTGPPGADLRAQSRFDQLKRLYFADCREAQFIRGLAPAKERPAFERFEALAQGYRLPSLLAPEDVPARIKPQALIAQMNALASELIRNGSSKDVIRVLDDHVLSAASDPLLVRSAAEAVAENRDLGSALRYLERVEKELFAKNDFILSALKPFRLQWHKDWLRDIIQKGRYYSGMAAFEDARRAFPDDPEIHLLNVEAEISINSWEKARGLLAARPYPSILKTRVEELGKRIQEQENEVAAVIRFSPGERSIRIEALLNDALVQKFILDTGAEKTAIPSSALKALGIEVDDRTEVQVISTATGLGLTHEVSLESIELKRMRVENMPILVIDLPGEPGYGILGLDFLNHFRFEIDNQRGLLHLRKKTPGERRP